MLQNCLIHGMFDMGKDHYVACPNCIEDIKPAGTSDGGPSSYYDFNPNWRTWNDFMEAKALSQWGAYSLHMKDIGKALCRFGVKSGTDDEYDMNKIVYSGLRMKEMKRRGSAREYLLRLLDDPQFQ